MKNGRFGFKGGFFVDGTYNVKLTTPLGKYNGTIDIKVEEEVLNGVMHVMGTQTPFSGKVSGESFSFHVDIKIMGMPIAADVEGQVNGQEISGDVVSVHGTMPFTGEKV